MFLSVLGKKAVWGSLDILRYTVHCFRSSVSLILVFARLGNYLLTVRIVRQYFTFEEAIKYVLQFSDMNTIRLSRSQIVLSMMKP